MNDNKLNEKDYSIERKISSIGKVQISEEVIEVIGATATLEVDGVSGLTAQSIKKKNISRGVNITIEKDLIVVAIDLTIKNGVKIKDTTEEVQKNVKNAIESMTSLEVSRVDINIVGLKEN